MSIPQAKKIPFVHQMHGHQRPDPYAWLKDKKNPEVISYLEDENSYTKQQMAHTDDLRQLLYDEMLERIEENDQSAPYKIDDWWRYTRTVEGKSYPIYCRKKLHMDAEEQVILDENQLAEEHDYYHLSSFKLSPDQNHVAWIDDVDGSEQFVLHVKDLRTGVHDQHQVEHLKWSIAWGDNDTVFYVRGDQAQRPYQIWKRRIGTPTSTDKLLWQEDDERFFLDVRRSRNGKEVIFQATSKITSEVRLLAVDDLDAQPRVVLPRKQGIEYSVAVTDVQTFVLHNENAKNFEVISLVQGERKVVIPHRSERLIEHLDAFADYLVIHYRQDGLPGVAFYNLQTEELQELSFPDAVYTITGAANPNFDANHYRLKYSSLARPQTTYEFSFDTRVAKVLKVVKVKGGFEPEDYETKRLWATATDGTKIPISLVYRKANSEGPRPTLLCGYGSYGYSYPVAFRSTNVSLLDRGMIYAVAHIRGGSEMGRDWYENGKFFSKQNTFDDFINCAEYLVASGVTEVSKLAIKGGSAGGLLMGAVINKRPDICHACIAQVPFVDVVSTMLDPNLPLTVIEYEEWGNPNKKEVYEYLCSYSPYDNVEAKDYPNLMVTAGLNDPRVGYWEPAKWVARLREKKTDDLPLIFRVHLGAGHGGASGRYGYLEDLSWVFAFILDRLRVS